MLGHFVAALLAACVAGAAGQAATSPPLTLAAAPDACTVDVRSSIAWGAATSAYQVEGGWDADGKSRSIWDTLAQTPGKIADNTTGDVACDMYHRWRDDVALMKQLGIKHYRLSIAWTRIVPGGLAGSPVNAAGVAWYRTFIKALLDAGIRPAVTMYHWDLPQVLQDAYGGFTSPRVQDDFEYYADVLFRELGDLVDQWMTFNEVISICELGYQLEVFAPAAGAGLAAKYTCGHNVLLAHARVVKLYRTKYAAAQKGRLSIALDGKWGYPRDPSNPADVAAAEAFMVFQYAWMADPLYFGDYPKLMRDTQGDALPRFTAAESALLRETTVDFFSVNFYCGYYVWAPPPGSPKELTYDVGANTGGQFISPGVPTNAAWLFKTPDGLRKTLVWLSARYGGPEFWVTENGVSGPGEDAAPVATVLNDQFRQDFYRMYLNDLCLAKSVDGVNVSAYYAWSLLDNFEWRDGFSKRFGMIYVDLKNNLKRSPKGTALWLSRHFYTPSPIAVVGRRGGAPAAAGAAAGAGAGGAAAPAGKPAGFALPFGLRLGKGGLGLTLNRALLLLLLLLLPGAREGADDAQRAPVPAAGLVERTDVDWSAPLAGANHPDPAVRPVIALGKFDALHKGHRALAAAALALGGAPVLLSFSGMGGVLGWAPRRPLVAPCDRPRVLELWARQLAAERSGAPPPSQPQQGQREQQAAPVSVRQRYIPFAAIRSMSPEAFVALLHGELRAAGVVAGENYRFGFKAAGDSALLRTLCEAAGLPVAIVELVGPSEPGAVGVVSSSKVREMLSVCRIEAVRKSLGRPYRLVAALRLERPAAPWPAQQGGQRQQREEQQQRGHAPAAGAQQPGGGLAVPQSGFLNQPPGPGVYLCSAALYLGATPSDDLLQLQQAADAAAGSAGDECGGGGGVEVVRGLRAAGSGAFAALRSAAQQVELSPDGLELPLALAAAAAAAATAAWSSSRSRRSSSNSSSSGSDDAGARGSTARPGGDPRCWDTDDLDDADDEAEGDDGGVAALLVLDFDACLRQTCALDQPDGGDRPGGLPSKL
ncbi:BGLU42 [Scenedesmus sp. PABB004]|nr:BGLU42 [Scenedesmus sp. PABB004]